MVQQDALKGTTIYITLALVVLAATGVHAFLQYNLLNAQKAAIATSGQRLETLSTTLDLRTKEFKLFAEAQAQKQKSLSENIAAILPPNENYTELTRVFDDFFAKNDLKENPIFQSSLRYGKGAPIKGMPGISGLPISMNIEATRDNFFKFLNFINEAGTVDTGRRLMSISSIQLNFPDGGEVLDNAKQVLNFTVEMVAYYQTGKIRK